MIQFKAAAPIQLAEKHRPRLVRDFAGLARVKALMGKLIANPYPSAWLFTGDSGTGKTTLALAVAAELHAAVHHVGSGQCNKEAVETLCEACHYRPMFSRSHWHVVIVDEADQMTTAAQLAFLSRLDATNFPPDTIFIFTSNDTARLEARFLSRLRVLPFNGAVDAKEFGDFLFRIWLAEAPSYAVAPLMHRIIAECGHNVRQALNEIEVELMMVPALSDFTAEELAALDMEHVTTQ